MQRRDFVRSAAALSLLAALPKPALAAQTQTEETTTMTTRPKSGYAPVNGIELYYEIHGDGKPLVLLHGGMLTIASEPGNGTVVNLHLPMNLRAAAA